MAHLVGHEIIFELQLTVPSQNPVQTQNEWLRRKNILSPDAIMTQFQDTFQLN